MTRKRILEDAEHHGFLSWWERTELTIYRHPVELTAVVALVVLAFL